jgi:hypothetical protein
MNFQMFIKNTDCPLADRSRTIDQSVYPVDILERIASRLSRSTWVLRLSVNFLRSHMTRIPWLSTRGNSWGRSQRRFPFCLAMIFINPTGNSY